MKPQAVVVALVASVVAPEAAWAVVASEEAPDAVVPPLSEEPALVVPEESALVLVSAELEDGVVEPPATVVPPEALDSLVASSPLALHSPLEHVYFATKMLALQ